MPTPKISVIVPCYNYGAYLPETIDSILTQTYPHYEVIIIDDGSNDGTTPAIIASEAKKDKRIKVITHPKNKGLSAARNSGIKAARGKYIFPVDSDDMIHATLLEKALKLMEQENSDIVYCHLQCFGEKTNILHFSNQEKIKKTLPFGCLLFPFALYKKSDVEKFGGYAENLIACEDWDFWLHYLKNDKKFTLLDEALYIYRTHQNSLSSIIKENDDEIRKTIKYNHPELYKWHNYYLTFNFLRYRIRPHIIQIRTRKGQRSFRLLGIVFYKE